MIRNWELAYHKQQELKQTVLESMTTKAFTDSKSTKSNESDVEPMRLMSVAQPPPKLFFRTFWRSVTRRIVQHEKNIALGRAVPTTSGAF